MEAVQKLCDQTGGTYPGATIFSAWQTHSDQDDACTVLALQLLSVPGV
jgi:hypothetical protein